MGNERDAHANSHKFIDPGFNAPLMRKQNPDQRVADSFRTMPKKPPTLKSRKKSPTTRIVRIAAAKTPPAAKIAEVAEIAEVPKATEPLAVPAPPEPVGDHCADSRLTIDGALSAPSYPEVPAVEAEPVLAANSSQNHQEFLTAKFAQIVVRRTLSMSKSLEESTTFTLTGVAAFIALAISNAGGLREVVSAGGFKAGIILFVASLLVGAMSKLFGAGVSAGVTAVKELEGELNSAEGANLMQEMTATPEQVSRGIAGSFPWPLSTLFESAATRGSHDPLTSEKIYTRLFFAQVITNLLHWLFAVSAILILAFSMAGRS